MMKVGVIGCGNIADIYFKNSKQYFNNFEINDIVRFHGYLHISQM